MEMHAEKERLQGDLERLRGDTGVERAALVSENQTLKLEKERMEQEIKL